MVYIFEQNESILAELLKYLIAAFGCQLNGNCFSNQLLHRWIDLKKIPEIYGDHKIITINKYEKLGNLLILTIGCLDREDAQFLLNHEEMRKDIFKDLALKQRRVIKEELSYIKK